MFWRNFLSNPATSMAFIDGPQENFDRLCEARDRLWRQPKAVWIIHDKIRRLGYVRANCSSFAGKSATNIHSDTFRFTRFGMVFNFSKFVQPNGIFKGVGMDGRLAQRMLRKQPGGSVIAMRIASPRQDNKIWREAPQDIPHGHYGALPSQISGSGYIGIGQAKKQAWCIFYPQTCERTAGFLFALCSQARRWPSA